MSLTINDLGNKRNGRRTASTEFIAYRDVEREMLSNE